MQDVGAVVAIANFFGAGVFGGFAVVEEENVCLYALGVEDAGGEAEDGVVVRGFEEVLTDGFSGSAFKEHVAGDHDGGAAGGFEHGAG